MDFSVIIVSFNTKELLRKAVASVFSVTKDVTFEVIVVDNNSTDGSVELIRHEFPQVKLIANRKNLGFGIANNQGAEMAKGQYLFFLNSDAFLTENSLLKIKSYLDDNPMVGCVGPLILNPDGSIQQSVGFIPHLPQVFFWATFLDDLPAGYILKPYHIDHDVFYQNEQVVGWVTGAAMIVRRKLFRKLGGFDGKIFMYGEDFELCYRLQKEGFLVSFVPVTSVIHLGRGSVGQSHVGAIVGEFKGLIYFYQKHRKLPARLFLLLLLKLAAILRLIIFGIILRRGELLIAYWKAFFVNKADFKARASKR